MIEVVKEKIAKPFVDEWFAQWEEKRTVIHDAHSRRDQSAKLLMLDGIKHYETFIIEASDSHEETITANTAFELLPINGMERLLFVKQRPGQYACYRQLDELFIETKKRCARLRLKK